VLFDDEEIIDVVASAVVASQTADPSPEDVVAALNNQEFDKAILVFKEELLRAFNCRRDSGSTARPRNWSDNLARCRSP
jgi:hypothetical protein